MKKFILTVLFVSVFFIGVGSIVEKTSAKFTSDAKALEIIKQTRIAIGGEANLKDVQRMTIVGSSTNFFEKEGIQKIEQGSLEINMKLPNQFSKTVKIGNPENAADGTEVRKEVNVFVMKKGDSDNVEWKSDNNENVTVEGDKIIIKKDDGTTEEIKIDSKNKIRIYKDSDGKVLTEDIENTNGKKVIIIKDTDGRVVTEDIVGPKMIEFSNDVGVRDNEMLRTTIALLMTAPKGSDVAYEFVGTGDVDGNPSNIIHVISGDSSFKLYLNATTNLPQMVSYYGNPENPKVFHIDKLENLTKEQMIEMKKNMVEQTVHNLKFSDFRSVGNLLLPYRWTESANNKQIQNIDITSYEINPANIVDKFGNQNVFVRKMKKN
jgi:hypothetical protein